MRRYLVSHRGEQVAKFVEVESGKRSDRPKLAAAKALAKRRARSLCQERILIDLTIADMSGRTG